MRSAAVCALSLGLALLAGSVPSEGADTATALTLEALMERMRRSAGVSAEFTERKELALLSEPLESRGRLYFASPDRLARFTTTPVFSALIIDGEAVRFREGEDEELDLSGDPVARRFVENFIVLWSGDRDRLERLYRVELAAAGERWQLFLSPRGAPLDKVIERIELRGDTQSLLEMVVRDRDGDRTTTAFGVVDVDRTFSPAELERIFEKGLPLDAATGTR
jgi:hypothetical protein